jgi:hypothetical protein
VIYLNNNNGKIKTMNAEEMPYRALVGKLGHELAHILDYTTMSNVALLRFSSMYVSSNEFMKKTERKTDLTAIRHGLSKELHECRSLALLNECVHIAYKRRLEKYYLSPNEIYVFFEETESNSVERDTDKFNS